YERFPTMVGQWPPTPVYSTPSSRQAPVCPIPRTRGRARRCRPDTASPASSWRLPIVGQGAEAGDRVDDRLSDAVLEVVGASLHLLRAVREIRHFHESGRHVDG